MDISSLSAQEQEELYNLLQAREEYRKYNQRLNFTPYPFQKNFYAAGKNYKRRFLMAANRIGKSFSEAQEVAYHLTQDYPDWWEGYRFDHPILCWCVGITGESTQKVLQKELFGTESARDEKSIGTGAIPKSAVEDVTRDGQRILMAKIKGKYGTSTIEFRSTQQGEHVLMGATVDYIWLDEEDAFRSVEIYSQCVTRTATTGGLVTITATPENGVTPLVQKFMDSEDDYLYLQNATWDDAPHITEDQKKELLASIPVWQHDMRSKGIPILGEGLVYSVDEKTLEVDPFNIPDHWPRVAGVDVGISHDTAVVWTAWDREEDVIYIYDAYHAPEGTPDAHGLVINRKGTWIPVILPHDADNMEKGSGKSVSMYYREAGVNAAQETFHNPITPDGKKNNHVEPGIMEMLSRMKTGRLKIVSTCGRFFEELRRYHRKDGKIVKKYDDTMDASRYAVMSLLANRGRSKAEACLDTNFEQPTYSSTY